MEQNRQIITAVLAMKEEGFVTGDELSLLLAEIASGRLVRANRAAEIHALFQGNALSRVECRRLMAETLATGSEPAPVSPVGNDPANGESSPAVPGDAAEQRKKDVQTTINGCTFVACLIGLLPLPVADAPLLILTQFILMKKLCARYGRQPGMGLTLIVASAFLGPMVFSSFAKLLPGLGSILGACIGGGFTYLVGRTTARILEKNEEFTWETIKRALSNGAGASGRK